MDTELPDGGRDTPGWSSSTRLSARLLGFVRNDAAFYFPLRNVLKLLFLKNPFSYECQE